MTDVKKLKLVGSSKVPSLSIPVEDFGTPGARIELHMVPQFEDSGVSDADVLGDTSKRAFRVSAKLSHTSSPIGRTDTDFGEKDGDSFLVVPGNAIRIDTLEGHFHIKANDAKQLSYIELECLATKIAENKFTTND